MNTALKLDFKHADAVLPSLEIITYNQNSDPLLIEFRKIWLNADILQGPAGRKPSIDPVSYLERCRDSGIQNMVISIGWTTDWSMWTVVNVHAYTRGNIQDTLRILAVVHTKLPITLAIRGTIFANTDPQFLLPSLQNGHTFTFLGRGWGKRKA